MKRSMRTTAILAAGLAAMGLSAQSVGAVEIPCSTARLIVPWGAGGESDILKRVVLEGYNRLGGKPELQVVTITGQGGMKGWKAAINAKPDGCTLFSIHEHVLATNLTGRTNFTWDSLVPIISLTKTPSLMGASPKTPFSNYKEMVEWTKANPGKLLAAGTLGSTSHFSLLLVQDALGLPDMKVVSYDGTADRMKALLAGTVHFAQVSESTGAKHVQSGALKILGINTPARSPRLPDVPTATEQGYPLEIASTRGVMAPKGTPPEIIEYYADMFEKAAKDKKVVETVEKMGSYMFVKRQDEYVKWWNDTNVEWTRIAKKVGVYKQGS